MFLFALQTSNSHILQLHACFCFPFYDLIDKWLFWASALHGSENEKLLAPQEKLLVPNNWMTLFVSLTCTFYCVFCRPTIGLWVLQDSNTLELANQSVCYIAYKQNPYYKLISLYQLSWKCKLATVMSYKADISSVSPSSELALTKG